MFMFDDLHEKWYKSLFQSVGGTTKQIGPYIVCGDIKICCHSVEI